MITIVSICSDAYRPLADLTIEQNKRPYCQKHGYGIAVSYVPHQNPQSAGYDRLEFMLDLMERPKASPDDWFWAMGVDTMIMNPSVRMERWVDADTAEHFDFVIARDLNMTNGDSFLVRASDEGKAIIRRILGERPQREVGSAESQHIEELSQLEPFKNWIKIVPQKGFNSYDYTLYGITLGAPYAPGMFMSCTGKRHVGKEEFDLLMAGAIAGQYSHGDFLIHWPGMGLEKRIELARVAIKGEARI